MYLVYSFIPPERKGGGGGCLQRWVGGWPQFKDSRGTCAIRRTGKIQEWVSALTPKWEKDNWNVWCQRGNLKSLHLNFENFLKIIQNSLTYLIPRGSVKTDNHVSYLRGSYLHGIVDKILDSDFAWWNPWPKGYGLWMKNSEWIF